jgi:hypothetical protein
VFNHTLFTGLCVVLNSRLTKVNSLLVQIADHVHYLLTVQETSHITNSCVLTDGILQSVEWVVEDSLMVANVRRRCLNSASSEFDDGSEC